MALTRKRLLAASAAAMIAGSALTAPVASAKTDDDSLTKLIPCSVFDNLMKENPDYKKLSAKQIRDKLRDSGANFLFGSDFSNSLVDRIKECGYGKGEPIVGSIQNLSSGDYDAIGSSTSRNNSTPALIVIISTIAAVAFAATHGMIPGVTVNIPGLPK